MKKILIIEDNREIAEMEQDFLEAEDFETEIACDGANGARMAIDGDYALVLLDIMLPGMDGFQVLKKIRERKEVPVLIVSAKREETDKIRGLGIGADDYITKPFSPGELVARVKSHIKRFERVSALAIPQKKDMRFGKLLIEPEKHRVFVDEREVVLTHKEFEVLEFLAENPGIVFSREQIFDRVWSVDAIGDTSTVMVHINRIRSKIEKDPSHPKYIETIRGTGYRFSELDQLIE